MKRVLIISPYFPPDNAADMQRVRMSLPFFKEFGWEAEVVCVHEKFTDCKKDRLLLESLPGDAVIHKTAAIPQKLTSKFGLGSLALRSLWHYDRRVMLLLQAKNYDLIYFSTTQFPVCILGNYWKKRFGIPYVIDMQDAWYSDYYEKNPNKPKPKKYWFSQRLNKLLERLTMKNCDGLISVSKAYLDTLNQRYLNLKHVPQAVIPFGAFEKDYEIAAFHRKNCVPAVSFDPQKINVVYIGRGGNDMETALNILFSAFKDGLRLNEKHFSRFHFHFIGTNYAPAQLARKYISPLAEKMELASFVTEITDRTGFYATLNTLQEADLLFVPGSDDPEYTPSKIYPYLLAKKPILAILNEKSSAVDIVRRCSPQSLIHIFSNDRTQDDASFTAQKLLTFTKNIPKEINLNREAFAEYSAREMTGKQVQLFDQVLG